MAERIDLRVPEHPPEPSGRSSVHAASPPYAGVSNEYGGSGEIAVRTAGRGNAGRSSGDGAGGGGTGAADGGGGGGAESEFGRELSEWQLFALQTSAVLRKNTSLQKRAWGQDLCLLGLPLLFCVLLLVLQRLVNTQLGSSDEYRCGCKCLECCDWVASGQEGSKTNWECYQATSERPCSPYAHCKARDPSECGAQYSTYAQIAFCDVRYPSTWPAVLQVPPDEYRPMGHSVQTSTSAASPSSPPSSLFPRPIVAPYTGLDLAASRNLSQQVVPRAGDRGIGARILRDLREVQQRLRSGTSGGAANSTNGVSSNPMLAVLSGALGGGRGSRGQEMAAAAAAAAAAGRSGGNNSGDGDEGDSPTSYIDLCDPSVDVAALLRSDSSVAPYSTTHGSVNGSASPASVAASLAPEQLAEAASTLTQILSDYDLLLGTATDAPYTNLLEPALIVGSRVLGASKGAGTSSVVHGGSGGSGHLLSVGGSVGGGGGVELDFTTDPDQALPLYYLSRNCSALTATDRLVMSQLSCALSRGMGLPELQCATWAPSWSTDAAAIERELFCGWSGTQCAASAASHVSGDGNPKATVEVAAAAAPPPPPPLPAFTSAGRRMLQQQQQAPTSSTTLAGPANSTVSDPVDPMLIVATTPKGEGIAPSGSAGVVVRMGTNTAAGPPIDGPPASAATAGGADVADGSERIVQYPSAVYDWRTSGPMGLNLTIWVNNSDAAASVAPRVQRWPAAINTATNAWLSATAASGGQGPDRTHWVLRLTGIKGFPTRGSPLRLDLASLMGPLFFMWIMQLLLPTYVHALVSERESGAELLMRQQGLRPAPAALAAYCWFAVLYVVFMLIFVGFGAAIGLNIFTKTSPGVQVVFYLVWGNAMISWAFWFASAWSSAGAATLAATTTVVLTGLVANMIVAQFVTSGPHWLATLLEAFPSFALFRVLWEMSQYAFLAAANGSPQGLTWSRLYDEGNGTTVAWALLAAVTVWSVMLTWYWGKVFGPDEQGVHSHPFFLLGFRLEPDDPRGWDWFAPAAARQRLNRAVARWQSKEGGDKVRKRGRDATDATAVAVGAAAAAAAVHTGNASAASAAGEPGDLASEEAAVAAATAAVEAEATNPEDFTIESEDVREERQRVEVLWQQLTAASGATAGGRAATAAAAAASSGGQEVETHITPPALLLRNVRKVFPGKGSAATAATTPGGVGGSPSPQAAVRNLSLAVGSRETLGLLGPNGAGKTTTLRIMQGILEPSSGSVLVCGLDLSSQSARVAQLVGICPQHDVLWPSLTGREHVRLFGRIKGLRGSALEAAVAAVLEEAGLGEVADRAAGGYSGGMQRRLSVVCALVRWRDGGIGVDAVGGPRVLYLDEPSTGLDPASRRLLWKAVLQAKRRCAVVLTTHSMEEAEALCDRLGVVVGGALRCIGTPQQLMATYSSYLMLSLTAAPCCSDEDVETFVRSNVSAGAKQVYCLNGFHSYEVPRRDVRLAELFRTMAAVQVDDDDNDNNQGAGGGEYGSTTSAAWTAVSAATEAAVAATVPGGANFNTQQHTQCRYSAAPKPQSCRAHVSRLTMEPGSGAQGALALCPSGQRVIAPGAQVALLDWAVSSATLERVFVRVCREAGAVVEAAVGTTDSGGV